jgi:branched-chain amino acid transport system substrate-binding protein
MVTDNQVLSWCMIATSVVALSSFSVQAAEKKYDLGASDTEIKIGNINPYSGPASAYGITGKTIAAYFSKVNDEGGVNGRKVTFITYDDGYSPPKAVEHARRLVESDEVLLLFQTLGTASNSAIEKYLNAKKVPQLFVATGASKFSDPKQFPWTMGWQPSYQAEGRIFAKYLLENYADGKIGVIYQNDDYGKDYLKGFKEELNNRIPIVAELPYEITAPTIESEIVNLKASGATIVFDITTPKFAAQAIRKIGELDWHPIHYVNNISNSIGSVLKPAGLDHAKGLLSAAFYKDPTDPKWVNDPAYQAWLEFMTKYYPDGDKTNGFTVYGYLMARTMVEVLRQCGDDLTRANIIKQAASLHAVSLDMLLPGITLNTSPSDYRPIKQLQMERFDGERWELFGPVLSDDAGG